MLDAQLLIGGNIHIIKRLTCCCCGETTQGRQWYNRDTGYGLCVKCATWIEQSGKQSAEDMWECYGKKGYHYAIEEESC